MFISMFSLFRCGLVFCFFPFLGPAHGQVGLTVFHESANYQSAQGTFNVSFGEKIPWQLDTPEPTDDDLIIKPNSEFLNNFSSSVMRAMNTLENTFANKSSRTINIHCIFVVNDSMTRGAVADPARYTGTKSAYTENDFNGRFTGQSAHVNNLEHIWKYGLYLTPDAIDVSIHYYSPTKDFGGFYVQQDTAGYSAGQLDVETVTLHEMGHALGFNTSYDGNSKTALDLLVRSQDGGIWEGTQYFFTGENAAELYGQEVQLMPGDSGFDSHIRTPKGCIMNDGTQNPGTMRQFTDLDLAMLQDMGWTLAVPEPSSAGLAVAAACSMMLRRRRRNNGI